MKNQIFHSKGLVYAMILVFIILVAYEALPGMECFGSKEESKPVVRVKKPGKTLTPAQKKRFDELLEEGKSLILNWEDYNAAIQRLSEAKTLAVTKEQKSDVYFYLSLAFFKKNAERSSKEFMDAVENLLLVDYFRKLDKDECPPRYIELFNAAKKEYGILRVVSNPQGADVYLNSSKSSAGKTPLTIARKAGKVKVRVKWGRKKKEESVEVIAGQDTLTPMFELTKKSKSLLYIAGGAVVIGAAALLLSIIGPGITTGNLQINSNPTGAQVFLDGRDTGQETPCLLKDIEAGSHTITLKQENYQDIDVTVTVTADETTTTETIELPKHVINVTSPKAGDQFSKSPYLEIEIIWTLDASTHNKSHVLSKSLSNVSRNITSQMRRQALISKSGAHALDVRGEESESKGPPRKMRIKSSGSSGFNGVFVPVNGNMTRDISEHMPGSAGPNINYHRRNGINRGDTMALMKMRRAGRLSQIGNPVTNKSFSSTKSRQKTGTLGELHILSLEYIDILLIEEQTEKSEPIRRGIQVSDGSYTWKAKEDYGPGTYKLRFQSHAENPEDEVVKFGESGLFYIVEAQYEWRAVLPQITDKDTKDKTDKGFWSNDPELKGAWGIAIDDDSHVYVADTGNDRVVKLDIKSDPRGEFVEEWPGTKYSYTIKYPHQIIYKNNFIYVAEAKNHRIGKYSLDGELINELNEFQTPGESPYGVAVANNGYVYALVYTGGIMKFNSDGTLIDKFQLNLDRPVSLAINSKNIIHIANRNGDNIVYCDSNGNIKRYQDGRGRPIGIAIDDQDHVFYIDLGPDEKLCKVFEYDPEGNELVPFGGFGESLGTFKRPLAIAFDNDGYVYVYDNYRHIRKITKFEKVYK